MPGFRPLEFGTSLPQRLLSNDHAKAQIFDIADVSSIRQKQLLPN
jgi:hypothetical protein